MYRKQNSFCPLSELVLVWLTFSQKATPLRVVNTNGWLWAPSFHLDVISLPNLQAKLMQGTTYILQLFQ